ncbi:uncharacterized protein UBRO_20227 [Ustilago bromivora]|uniref:Uncharacterized protein n=1 Tax=Ustilago bromivora TaxID=307758 RepID=A0A1K0GDH8_9BASI|nr:uncharacterized protein UBRO_20227 [Ustilago bromivora]SYW80754.1 uncharacterized protein UBRO2_03968 [Ustilago bromivora]
MAPTLAKLFLASRRSSTSSLIVMASALHHSPVRLLISWATSTLTFFTSRACRSWDVRNTEVYDLQQALVDYDHVYVYGNKRGARQESVIKVFAHQTPIDPAPQSSAILQKVTASRCFEKTWGPKLGAHEADEKGAMPRSVAASSKLKKRAPGDSSGSKDFDYYLHLIKLKPNMPTLTNDELEEHFGTQIYYKGTPMLSTKAVSETVVQHALKHFGKVWLIGPASSAGDVSRYLHLQKVMENDEEILDPLTPDWKPVHQDVEAVRKFGLQYGDNALYLRYGRPFAKRKKPGFLGFKAPGWKIVEKAGIREYKVPEWKDIEKQSTIYNLRETGLPELRAHLDKENYLKVHDPLHDPLHDPRLDPLHEKLLGFALDKDGSVLFKDFSQHVRA